MTILNSSPRAEFLPEDMNTEFFRDFAVKHFRGPQAEVPVPVTRARIIHAGPTAGKSTLVAALRSQGVSVIDTDEILAQCDPTFYAQGRHVGRGRSAEEKAHSTRLKITVVEKVAEQLDKSPDLICFTNIWGDITDTPWRPYADPKTGKLPLSLWVEPVEMARRSAYRDGSSKLSLSLCSKWWKEWLTYGPQRFRVLIPLSEHMSVANSLSLDGHPALGLKQASWAAVTSQVSKLISEGSETVNPPTSGNQAAQSPQPGDADPGHFGGPVQVASPAT